MTIGIYYAKNYASIIYATLPVMYFGLVLFIVGKLAGYSSSWRLIGPKDQLRLRLPIGPFGTYATRNIHAGEVECSNACEREFCLKCVSHAQCVRVECSALGLNLYTLPH